MPTAAQRGRSGVMHVLDSSQLFTTNSVLEAREVVVSKQKSGSGERISLPQFDQTCDAKAQFPGVTN